METETLVRLVALPGTVKDVRAVTLAELAAQEKDKPAQTLASFNSSI